MHEKLIEARTLIRGVQDVLTKASCKTEGDLHLDLVLARGRLDTALILTERLPDAAPGLTAAQLADALDWFGNDAIGAMHSGTADVACIATGFAAVASRLIYLSEQQSSPAMPEADVTAEAVGQLRENAAPKIGDPARWEPATSASPIVDDAREATTADAVHIYVRDYDFEFDDGGFYTPTDSERAMLEDAITGFVSTHDDLSTPTGGTASSQPCPSCDGDGIDLYDGAVGRDCQVCHGRGVAPTGEMAAVAGAPVGVPKIERNATNDQIAAVIMHNVDRTSEQERQLAEYLGVRSPAPASQSGAEIERLTRELDEAQEIATTRYEKLGRSEIDKRSAEAALATERDKRERMEAALREIGGGLPTGIKPDAFARAAIAPAPAGETQEAGDA